MSGFEFLKGTPGQIINTGPAIPTAPPVVVVRPRPVFWTLARRAPKMWLNPLKSAQPPKTMSMVRARRWQEEENLATRRVRLLGVLQSAAASLRKSHQSSPTLI